mmetsp:Transcript_62293/g.148717  ORF Transcript_62293/g.148717 Transcript_62293/m.148717 type:complete len:561 (+) Transcript_62293:72-1754(+)
MKPRGNSNKIQKDNAATPAAPSVAEASRSRYPTHWRGQTKELKHSIKEKLTELKVRETDTALIEECVEELRREIAKIGPEWKLELFGSIASGFGTRYSDLDATFVLQADAVRSREDVSPASVLRDLAPHLEQNPKFGEVTNIAARVPILKVRFCDKLDVDLSVNNTQAIQNTKLLKAYADIDERVKELTLLVKHWAKSAGVCGASERYLSSYTFTIMVIYFMQVHRDVTLPFLSTNVENLAEAVRSIQVNKMMKCQKPLADLLKLFFEFYATVFDWGQEVVCIRFGRRMELRGPGGKSNPMLSQLRGTQVVDRIHVEDPYELERNLNCVLGIDEEQKLFGAFQDAHSAMQRNLPPSGFELRRNRTASETTGMTTPEYMASPSLSWTGEVPNNNLSLLELVEVRHTSTDAASFSRPSRSPSETPDHSPSPLLSYIDEAMPARLGSGASSSSRSGPFAPGPILGQSQRMKTLLELEAQFHGTGVTPEVTPEEPSRLLDAELPPSAWTPSEDHAQDWLDLNGKQLSRTTKDATYRLWQVLRPQVRPDKATAETKVVEKTIVFQ